MPELFWPPSNRTLSERCRSAFARPDSDSDIVCCAIDRMAFVAVLWRHFGEAPRFACHQWIDEPRPVVAQFEDHGWMIQIFGSPEPVQWNAGCSPSVAKV